MYSNKLRLFLFLVVTGLLVFFAWDWFQAKEGIISLFGSLASLMGLIWLFFQKPEEVDRTVDKKALLRRYYQSLSREASQLDLTVIDDTFTQNEVKLTLPTVYQDQYVRVEKANKEASGDGKVDKEEAKSVPLLEAIADDKNNRLVILGAMGSGKSSFIDYLAWGVANTWLGENDKTINSSLRQRPVVRIILRNVAAEISHEGESADLILRAAIKQAIERVLGDQTSYFFDDFYQSLVEQGIILLDGLDEVPKTDGRRYTLLDAVDALVNELGDNAKIVVTSRPVAYEDHRLEGFQVLQLEAMKPEQIEAFIHHWYAIMPHKDTWNKTSEKQAEELSFQVLDKQYLERLAEIPLLLTLIASLHYANNILPNSRAELYESSLTLMLHRWHQRLTVYKKNNPLEAYEANALSLGPKKLAMILGKLALHVHKRQREEQKTNKSYSDISEIEARGMFDTHIPDVKNCQAVNLLDFLQFRSGILAATGEGYFKFVHRSFQEYLAARDIYDQPDWREQIQDLLKEDAIWWREVFLLIIGRVAENSQGDAMSFLLSLVPEPPGDEWQQTDYNQWKRILLTAEASVEQDLDKIYQQHDAYKSLYKNLQLWLGNHMTWQGGVVEDRAKAGDLLGLLGDPRSGIAVIENTEGTVTPDIGWVKIHKGSFLMGGDEYEEEQPIHEQVMPDYQISRFLITNAQYAVFIQQGGYNNKDFWSDIGWQQKNSYQWEAPRYCDQAPWNISNHPVVGVSWYEASAYVCWLNSITPQGNVRLPTEREWEYAARGEQSLNYPWGDDWQKGLSNTRELALQQTTAVGSFPQEKSPFSVEDMTGNVWEWTRSQWGKEWEKTDFRYPYDPNDGREEGNEEHLFVLRGGSWDGSDGCARCAFRGRGSPHSRGGDVGFRVLLSLASDS